MSTNGQWRGGEDLKKERALGGVFDALAVRNMRQRKKSAPAMKSHERAERVLVWGVKEGKKELSVNARVRCEAS